MSTSDQERARLEKLIRSGASVREIAALIGVKPETLRKRISRLGLPQPNTLRKEQVADALAQGQSEVERVCRSHGPTAFALVGSARRPRCKKCRSEAVARRRRRMKEMLVEEAGGRCLLCGYERSVAALEFHHRDPRSKKFGIAARGITRSLAEVRAEAAKCVLLCANCHAEVEAGVARLPIKS